ncbi:MAG: arginine--tRNA ligase [Methanoculleaceae archaeon]
MYRSAYREIRETISRVTGEDDPAVGDGGDHADFASTISFRLAKKERRSPVEIAGEVGARCAEELSGSGIEVEVAGPYINFSITTERLVGAIREAVRPGYGTLPPREERVVLEHTSANPNGPLHVGHIRNTIIGDTLARALVRAGFPLEVQYYVNDMGRQIAIVTWGLENSPVTPREGEKKDHFIARVYASANRALEENPGKKEEIDRRMQLVEAGDPGMIRTFRLAVDECLAGIRETLSRLNVRHDRFVWESDFVRIGDVEDVIKRVRQLPQCREDDILYLDLSGEGIEKDYVLLRSDGTSVYSTRDLAYHIWKAANFDRMIDVLGADHKLIGAQLQATLRLIGEKPPEIVYFEFVSLPGGSMSTRAGTFVAADDLIDQVTAKAMDEVAARRPDLSPAEQEAIARSVAIAAIRYDIIRVSPEKSTVFDWREALDFERQSGPYLQYAHARACGILDKAGGWTEEFSLATPEEIRLARQIARFPLVLERVVGELRPHLLAAYARDLADEFNAFYHRQPVLKSEPPVRNRRLTLVKAVQNTLAEVLNTLGIDALRGM